MSQNKRIVEILKCNMNGYMTARDIASELIKKYPDIYNTKKLKSNFATEKELIQQIVAEIGSNSIGLSKLDSNILIQDKPRPRKFCYKSEFDSIDEEDIGVLLLCP